MKNSTEQQKYEQAKVRVAQVKKFYNNLFSYTITIGALAAINYYQNQWSYPWFLWAAFGWGIGLIFHAAGIFGVFPGFTKNWEERKIRKYMEEENNSKQLWK